MKNRISLTMLLIVLFGIFAGNNAQTYTIDIVTDDVWWSSKENFYVHASAVIYKDGQPIPTSSDYYYEWQVFFGNEGYWRPHASGYGENGANVTAETVTGYVIILQVKASDVVNHTFTDITSDYSDVHNIPGTAPGDTGMSVEFKPVQENGQSLTTTVSPEHWRYPLFPAKWKSGFNKFLTKNVTERVKSTPNYVESLHQKLRYWDNTPSNILNFNEFIFNNPGVIKPQYWSVVSGVILQNNFLSAPQGTNPTCDSIAFKDPWLIDYPDPDYGNHKRNRGMKQTGPDSLIFKTRPSPFNPDYTTDFGNGDVYQGVFLNQNPQFQQGKPIYSVRAVDGQQITVNGKSITWDWESWSYDPAKIELQSPNNPETAVVFKQDGATLTANLKGRQVSSTTSATADNNSRKVVWVKSGSSNYYFQTYIDNGHVYYAYSTNAGATWSKEERVSQSGGNSEPCIAVAEDMSKITVVWNNNGEFFWRSKTTIGGSWGNIYSQNPSVLSNVSTKPTAVDYNGNVYVAIRYQNGSNPAVLELYKINSSNQLTFLGQIDGGGANNPTMTRRNGNNYDSRLFIAWEKNNGIYFRTFYATNGTFTSIETVAAPGSGIYFHNTPSIAYSSDHRINVAWVGSNGVSSYLLMRYKYSYGGWGPQSIIYSSYASLTQPSIGAYYNSGQTGWLNISVKFGSNNVRTLQWDKNNWSFHPTWLSGQYPSLTEKGEYTLLLIGTDHTSGAPYDIFKKNYASAIKVPVKGLSTENVEFATHTRREAFDLSALPGNLRGSVSIEVGELSVNGEQWHFMEDSTAISRGIFMQSEPLTVTANTNSVLLRYAATVEDFQKPGNGVPNVPLLRLRLVDADNGKMLRQVASVRLKDLRDGNWRKDDTLSIDLSAFRGRTVVLQMQTARHFLDNSGSADYVNIYRFDDPVNTQPLAKHTVELLPQRFALLQNYPNPFNPATTLGFELPQAAEVQLRIYDLQGRLVKTVVAGRYEAGRHSAVWDGTDEAGTAVGSGVYFYRLTAFSGAAPFTETRKMLLLR